MPLQPLPSVGAQRAAPTVGKTSIKTVLGLILALFLIQSGHSNAVSLREYLDRRLPRPIFSIFHPLDSLIV
jgi:hypothetical protein